MGNGTNNRRAGIIYVKVDGRQYDAKGAYTYNLGKPKRDAIIGSDGVHGYKETPQVAFIEGAVTDSDDLDLASLVTADNVTVTLELNNGKTIFYNGREVVNPTENRVEVYNIAGVMVMSQKGNADLSRLAKGIYIVRCGNEILKIRR